jgi:hypothetical protein
MHPTDADLFRRGKQVLGQRAGGLIARLFRENRRDIRKTLAIIEMASTKENPLEYVGRILSPLPESKDHNPKPQIIGGYGNDGYRV